MSTEIMVNETRAYSLKDFLESHDYFVETLKNDVVKVSSSGSIDVFIKVTEKQLYFELELGNIAAFASEKLYLDLLNLNTEILPVSIGLDTTSSSQSRLVIIESRERKNLDDNEMLAVFEALEIAANKAEVLLNKYITK